MTLLRAVTTMGSLTMVSRILGFVRDVLMARMLGAGAMADCFVIAFKLPNLFRRLFAEGAFSAAFVPLFSGHLEQGEDGPEARRAAAIRFAEDALSVMVMVLVVLVAVAQVFMPWVILVLGAGFADNQPKYDLAVVLSRLTFPYLLFISLVSLMGGVLNAFHRFAAVAFTPVLLNVVLIFSLLFFNDTLQTPAHALAVGVSVAGAAQLAWLLVACKRQGITLKLRLPRLSPEIRRLFTLMMPVVLGAGAYQIGLFIDTFLAGFLADGSIAYLYYADRLNQLPLGVIGIAIGTALLPMLSRNLSAGDDASARASQNRAVEIALLATLPAAAALALFPDVLIRTLFERREFTPAMTDATAAALTAFALGLPAYVLVKVFSPAYFARRDTKTPVRYALIALAVNVVLNLILMVPLKHVGLALATSIAAWLNAGLLMRGLYRRGDFAPDSRLRRRVPRIVGATFLMMAACWGLLRVLEPMFMQGTAGGITALVLLVAGGMVAYAVSAFGLGAMTKSDLALVRRRPPSNLPPPPMPPA